MFVHAAVAVSGVPVGQMELVRGKTLAKKLQDLGHVKNVGRSIAPRWGLKGMVRSDGNPVSRSPNTTHCLLPVACDQSDGWGW